MKTAIFCLAIFGLCSGVASAYFWWRSAQLSIEITTRDEAWNAKGGAFIFEKDLTNYLQQVSRKNTTAAIWSGVAIGFSSVASFLSLLLP
jgi:hypothetical protein